MSKTSLFDVFQSAAQFGNTAFGVADTLNQEKAKSELQSAEIAIRNQYRDFLIRQEGSAEMDETAMFTDWMNEKTKIQNKVSQSLSSPYAKEIVNDMMQNLDMEQQDVIQVYAQKRKANWTLTNNRNNLNTQFASAAYTEDEKIASSFSTHTSEYEAGLISYEQYDAAIRGDLESLATVDMLTQARNSLKEGKGKLEAGLQAIDTYSKQYALHDGKNLPLEAIKENARKKITLEWKTEIEALQDQTALSHARNWTDILATGNPLLAKKGLEQLQSYRGYELDEDRQTEYAEKYARFLSDLEKDPKGNTAIINGLKSGSTARFHEIVALIARGEKNPGDPDAGLKNLRIGKEVLQQVNEEQIDLALKAGATPTQISEVRESMFKMNNDIFTEVRKVLPQYQPALASKINQLEKGRGDLLLKAMGITDKQVKENRETAVLYQNTLAELDGSLLNLFMSTNFATTTPEMYEKEVDNIYAALVGKQLDIVRKNPVTGKGGFVQGVGQSEHDVAAAYITGTKNSALAYKTPSGDDYFLPGVEEEAEKFRSYGKREISELTGIPAENIKTSFEQTKGGQDVDAVTIFTTPDGKQYKYDVKDKKPILLEKTASTGWKERTVGTTAQKKEIEKKAEEVKTKELQKRADSLFQANKLKIQSSKNPLPGYDRTWADMDAAARMDAASALITKNPQSFLGWYEKLLTTRTTGGR